MPLSESSWMVRSNRPYISFATRADRVPGDEAGFHWQSIALVQKGQFEAALELADKGISLRPTAFGSLQRCEVLLAVGCEEAALADAAGGLRFDPNTLALTSIKGAAL